MINYHYFIEYLPKRYDATDEQKKNRQLVYSFKDGNISIDLLNKFLEKIREISAGQKNWLVCFIPASSTSRTQQRFKKLADFLSRNLKCSVKLNAMYNTNIEICYILSQK